MHSDMNCDELQIAMRQGRALAADEQAHVEGCDTCTDAWLDAAVVKALEAKPEAPVPEGFAAKVMAGLLEKHVVAGKRRRYAAPWGLITAAGLVGAGLVAAMVADPGMMTTRMGVIFEGLVAAEIAGIALWLGCWPHGRTAFHPSTQGPRVGGPGSRGHSRWT
ncbi:MAG TPA: hypothetical protein VME86_08885 [Acidobacteriaceae bacterium]|nr:hypothetical protein [Acidobacteriaceae bacterium]